MTFRTLTLPVCLGTLTLCGCSFTGCEPPGFGSPPPPRNVVVVIDATTVGLTPSNVMAAILPSIAYVVENRTSITIDQLDSKMAITHVVTFMPSAPVSSARKYLEQYHAEQTRDAEKVIEAVIPNVLANVPSSSPVASSILAATASRTSALELIIMSDGRDTTLGVGYNLERGKLPSVEAWIARLRKLGFTNTSLNGVTVHFRLMPLVTPTDTDASPARGLFIRDLWRAALKQFGAADVTFDDNNQGSLGAGFLFFGAPLTLSWMKFRVWMIAKRDHHRGLVPDARSACESQIKREPLPDKDDPEVPALNKTLDEESKSIERLKQEIPPLRVQIARQPNVVIRITGITCLIGIDGIGSAQQISDVFGTPSPNNYFYGIGLASTIIGMSCYAAKAANENGKKPLLYWFVIGGAATLIVSMTIVKITSAPQTGDSLPAIIAGACIQCAIVIGPAFISEMLFAQLRISYPGWKHLRELRKQLKEAIYKHKKALAALIAKGRERRNWRDCYSILRAVYNRGYGIAAYPINPLLDITADNERDENESEGLPEWPQ